jgi:hypothetical protein
MDSQWAQISITKLENSKITADYKRFTVFTKDSLWAHCTDFKGLKEF